MGQCPGKRNVDWNGGGMGKEQRYDRPTPHVVATSAPEFEDGEQGVDNSDCRHHRRPGFRPRIDGPDRASDYPKQDPYERQQDGDVLALELSRSRPQDPIGGSQKRVADDNRPKVGDRATENDDKCRRDGSGDKPRSPQSQRRYPSVLQP